MRLHHLRIPEIALSYSCQTISLVLFTLLALRSFGGLFGFLMSLGCSFGGALLLVLLGGFVQYGLFFFVRWLGLLPKVLPELCYEFTLIRGRG